MCLSSHFPEAIPLQNIKASSIGKVLITFFTFVGLPKSVQSDQGLNLMSVLFQQVMCQLGIQQFKFMAYHPQCQGALEKFHQILKNIMREYCFEESKDWDKGVHLLLFAVRESVHESLGLSTFELVFGHILQLPLKLLKEAWIAVDSSEAVITQVIDVRHWLMKPLSLYKGTCSEPKEIYLV